MQGAPGEQGETGAQGEQGDPGPAGGNVEVAAHHGKDFLLSTGEFLTADKFYADTEITAATLAPDGTLTLDFTVANEAGDPWAALPSVNANVAKLVADGPTNKWVNYLNRVQTAPAGVWGDAGCSIQAYRESSGNGAANGTLVNHGDGSYTYTYRANLQTATWPTCDGAVAGPAGALIGFEPTATHRAYVSFGGHSGATGDDWIDFVPDGVTPLDTRDIMQTATCKACHGEEFHGHGGDRLTLEGCVTCHNAGSTEARGGTSLEMRVMTHRIHAGSELPSVKGPDGFYWNNPATPADEMADNTPYIFYTSRGSADFSHVGFPALIENCTKCHTGDSPDVDNWKTKSNTATCTSCHDDVDLAVGTNHAGGAQANDQGCTLCHPADGNGLGKSVSGAHNWMNADPRNIPEFDVTLTVTGAANGTHFVAGESPVIHLVARDHTTAALLDHTAIRAEAGGAEGCLEAGCPAGDGLYTAPLFVHGPRANRQPVLTTKARVEVTTNGVGPFNLSALPANAALTFTFDQGVAVRYEDATGGDKIYAGVVAVPFVAASFGNTSAVSPTELRNWLNANAAFAARGIAYLEPDGRLSVRSRNLGKLFALKVDTGDIATTIFPAPMVNVVQVVGGFTVSNSLAQQANASANDPKAAWLPGEITYTLDPVDDLEPGTYVASIEFGDRGRVDGVNYRTPAVAKVTFNVKQADEELAPAGNCGDCHQNNSGTGFVLDYARHYKIFDDTAVDQCGACHDYQPGAASDPAGANVWNGSKPISRRVHAIHFGSSLNYPLATNDYSNGDPIAGRNWNITYPQDVRNCETCHKDENTSGTWATNANRLACSGCHDSDASMAHFRLQTFDPTPAAAWSGDEEESCTACH